MKNPVVADEIELLAEVSKRLGEMPEARTASEAPIVHELERLRAVILSGDEAKDISALSEQYHHQSAVLSQLRRAGETAPVDRSNPYFAHLRLMEAGNERDLCLGRTTCIERGMRIIDWRDAPISKIFYSYRQGDEYDEEIAGRERIGKVAARRMVRIRDGILERVQAPEGDFTADSNAIDGWRIRKAHQHRLSGGEGQALRIFNPGEAGQRYLGRSEEGRPMQADKRLPEITGLIDQDQFGLITRDSGGFLIVRGTAGSGKTTVALHRVAYLAFADPQIDSPDSMVVVFSRSLRNFVSQVLPSLGLSQVRVTSYGDWALEERRRHFKRLPSAQREDTPALIQRIKLHPFIEPLLEEYVRRNPRQSANWETVFDDWATILREGSLLREVSDDVAPDAFSAGEIAKFVDWHGIQIEDVLSHLAGDEEVHASLDPEDDVLLLRLWQLRVGTLRGKGKRPLRLRHLVIDEVQDFSPIEVRVLLGCVEAHAGITLAGDTQQHVLEHSGFSSWSDFFAHLEIPGTEVETLRIAYRSSRQIVEFAGRILGELLEEEEPPETPKEGPPIELFQFDDQGSSVAFIAQCLQQLSRDEPMASLAILTGSKEISKAHFEALVRCDLPRLRWVQDQDFSFSAGVEIAEIDQVKGLEFDYVILVDVDSRHFPDTPQARRRLHVGASRAIHQLWLISVATPSPIVEGIWQA